MCAVKEESSECQQSGQNPGLRVQKERRGPKEAVFAQLGELAI